MSHHVDLIVVQTVEPVTDGQEFARIPFHTTVLPWFALGETHLDEFVVRFRDVAKKIGGFATAVGHEREMFGPNLDTPVCTLEVPDARLHEALKEVADEQGAIYNRPQFVENWAPHISDEGEEMVQPGETVTFGSVALFSRLGEDRKRVEASVSIVRDDEK